MCYGLSLDKEQTEIEKAYFATLKPGLDFKPFEKGSNIYDCNLYCIPCENPSQIYAMNMGISPSWGEEHGNSKPRKYKIININADSAYNWERYAKLVRERRCLILADGFFETDFKDNLVRNSSASYTFRLKGQQLFAVAGIYDIYDENRANVILLTTKFKKKLPHPLCERTALPMILDPDFEADWLDSSLSDKEIQNLLHNSFIKEDIEAHSASSSIRKPNITIKLQEESEKLRKI